MKRVQTLVSVISVISVMASGAALAEGKGHGKSYKQASGFSHCPPGLAKKSPACVPPGQAKKHSHQHDDDHYDDGRYDDHHDDDGVRILNIGDRIDGRDYHLITRPRLYGLPPLRDGTRYVIVDGQIMRIDRESLEILGLIRMVRSILD